MYIKKAIMLILLVILLIFNIALAKALQAGYKIEFGELTLFKDYASKKFKHYSGYYKACEHDKSLIPILISNFENKKISYNLNLRGEKWTALPKKITLSPKQTRVIFLSLFPSEDSEGTYVFGIEFVRVDGSKITREIPVLVEKCYSISMEKEKPVDKGCECEDYGSEFKLSNVGKSNITVNLTLNAPEWIGIDESIINLGKEESRLIGINGVVPCNASGIFNIGIEAIGIETSNIKAGADYTLEVLGADKCTQADILGKDIYTISDKSPIITLGLKNAGAKLADYSLESDAEWLTITPSSMALKPEEEGIFRLRKRAFELDKEHNVKIMARADNYTYSKELKLTASSGNIFNDDVIAPIISFGMAIEGFFYFYRYYFFTGLVIGGVIILGIIYFVSRKS